MTLFFLLLRFCVGNLFAVCILQTFHVSHRRTTQLHTERIRNAQKCYTQKSCAEQKKNKIEKATNARTRLHSRWIHCTFEVKRNECVMESYRESSNGWRRSVDRQRRLCKNETIYNILWDFFFLSLFSSFFFSPPPPPAPHWSAMVPCSIQNILILRRHRESAFSMNFS